MKKISLLTIFAICFALHASDNSWQIPPVDFLPQAIVSKTEPTAAKWIWFRDRSTGGGTCYFRFKFELEDEPVSADVNCIIEHSGNIYVNGKEIRRESFPQRKRQLMATKINILPALKKGSNIFAAKVTAIPSHSGDMIVRGIIKLKSGKTVYLWSSDKFKVSTAPQGDWKALDHDDSSWSKAFVQGNAYSGAWSFYGDIVEHFALPEELAAYNKRMNRIQNAPLPASLAGEPPMKAAVKYHGDMAGIEINGKMFPPFIRLGLWNMPDSVSDRDAIAKTHLAGGRIIEVNAKINKSFPIGKYPPKEVDSAIRATLDLAPEAYIILHVEFVRMDDWSKANPDETVKYYREAQASEKGLYGFTPDVASAASDKFREAFIAEIKDLCQQVKTAPWGKRVVGFRLNYGWFGEWIQYGSYFGMPDHSKPMLAKFRTFLKKKYATDAALQKAWNNTDVTLKTAKIPGFTERWGRKQFLREPGTGDQQTWDFYVNTQEVMSDLLISLATAIKEELPDTIVGAWDGYDYCGYSPEGQHVWSDKLLNSGKIDFLSMPYAYGAEDRRAGDPGFHQQILSRFRRTDKLTVLEADIRAPHELARGADPDLTMANDEEFSAVIRRDFANMFFFNGSGVQFNAWTHPGVRDTFNYPCVHQTLHDSINLWQKAIKNPPALWGYLDTAVVYDSKQFVYHGYPEWFPNRDLVLAFGIKTMNALMLSGHPFELYTIEDFLESKHEYKRIIVLNQFYLTDAQRKKLKAKTQKKGVSTIWIYAPGMVTEKGFSDQAMSELTGINLRADRSGKKLPLRMQLTDYRIYDVPQRSEHFRVSAVDPRATVLARYVNDAAPAMVRKVLPSGAVSIFCGIPVTDMVLWDSLLSSTGKRGIIEPGTLVRMNDKYMMIHVGEAGIYIVEPYELLPEYTDLYTGKTFTPKNGKLYLQSKGPETWFFNIGK